MDLDFTPEQNMLRDTARSICEDYYNLSVVRASEISDKKYPRPFWEGLVDSGLTGLIIPECYGGVGMGLLEAVVVYEELGRHLASSPLFSSSILAARAIETFGNEKQKSEWLKLIASGNAIVSVGLLEADGGYNKEDICIDLVSNELSGEKIFVPFANSASHLLILANDEKSSETVLCLIDILNDGIEVTLQQNISTGAFYKVRLTRCRVSEENIFRVTEDSWGHWQQVMSFSAIVLSAESSGGAERMLDMTAEYSKTRVQFGKAIGAFQSLSHYMAELAVEVEGSKVLNYQAAWAQESGKSWMLLAAQAKLQSGLCFRKTTAVGTQIHGGIGFTSEADPQLYFRRAKTQQILHWDPQYLESRIAALLIDDLPA